MLVVTAGDRAVTVRERAGIPNAGNNGRDPIGDRARSLTVTALSCGAYFMISWQMKFQLSLQSFGNPVLRRQLIVSARGRLLRVQASRLVCAHGLDTPRPGDHRFSWPQFLETKKPKALILHYQAARLSPLDGFEGIATR